MTGINTSALSRNETNNSPITTDLPHVVQDEMKDKFIGKAILDLAHLVEPFEPPLDHQVLLIYCCGYKLSMHYACFMKIPISYNSWAFCIVLLMLSLSFLLFWSSVS